MLFRTFGCGIIGGSLASLFTQPADVVKTRMQLCPSKYSGNVSAIISIIRVRNGFSLLRNLERPWTRSLEEYSTKFYIGAIYAWKLDPLPFVYQNITLGYPYTNNLNCTLS